MDRNILQHQFIICLTIKQLYSFIVMNNGLQITGMKLSSPAPAKKSNVSSEQIKPKQTPSKQATAKKAPVPSSQIKKSPVVQKKEVTKKNQQKPVKKQQKAETKEIKEVKVEPKIDQEQIVKVEEIKQQQKKVDPILFDVVVRYNHYKQKFPCIDEVLSFDKPNEKYCFGLVFKGNYQPLLRNFKTREIIQPLSKGKAAQFSWKVAQGQIYEVQIQEDEQQQSKYQRTVYKAPQKNECALKKKNKDDLTEDMKKMGIHELGSQKHKQLLEQRDLQDILFG